MARDDPASCGVQEGSVWARVVRGAWDVVASG